jgi:hypothetical protein
VSNGSFDLRSLREIAGENRNIASVASEFVMGAAQFTQVTGQQDDATAFSANLPRQHQSEAAGAARDHDHFAVESEIARGELAESPRAERETAQGKGEGMFRFHTETDGGIGTPQIRF